MKLPIRGTHKAHLLQYNIVIFIRFSEKKFIILKDFKIPVGTCQYPVD